MILHVLLNLQNQYLMFALLPLRIKLFNQIRLNLETLGNLMLKAFSVTCICFRAWVELDCKQNVDEMWECWKTLFLQVLDKHAPKR
jgi:hypothetical protein